MFKTGDEIIPISLGGTLYKDAKLNVKSSIAIVSPLLKSYFFDFLFQVLIWGALFFITRIVLNDKSGDAVNVIITLSIVCLTFSALVHFIFYRIRKNHHFDKDLGPYYPAIKLSEIQVLHLISKEIYSLAKSYTNFKLCFCNYIFVFLYLCLFSTLSFSREIDDVNNGREKVESIIEKVESIIHREQINQNRQFENDKESKGLEVILLPTLLEKNNKEDKGACHVIEKITINNNTLLSVRHLRDTVRIYEGQCLGVNKIQSLLGDLTNKYITRGYITSRVYLPPQNLSSGELELNVEEGRIEKITQKNKSSLWVPGAFPTKRNDYLNLRDIEQGLEQINRLASNNATMSLIPGTQTGETQIEIDNTPLKRWKVNMSIDNHGSESTGRENVALALSFDNPLNINDYFSLTYKQDAPNRQDEAQWEANNSITFSYVVPYGYNTFSIGTGNSGYKNTLITKSEEQ
jgi:hemolysin activation/secretion protein